MISYRKYIPLWIIAAGALVAACQTETERMAKERQETAIDNYITAQLSADSTRTMIYNGGAYRLVHAAGEGDRAAAGDKVYFRYVGYIFTNGKGTAFDANKDTLGLHPVADRGAGIIGNGYFIAGLDKGLEGMRRGERADIVFPSTLGYGNSMVGIVPSLSALLFEVEMIKIEKQ